MVMGVAQLKLLQPIQGDGQQGDQSATAIRTSERTVPQNGTLGLTADTPAEPSPVQPEEPTFSSQPTWDQGQGQPAANQAAADQYDQAPVYPGFTPQPAQPEPASAPQDQPWQQPQGSGAPADFAGQNNSYAAPQQNANYYGTPSGNAYAPVNDQVPPQQPDYGAQQPAYGSAAPTDTDPYGSSTGANYQSAPQQPQAQPADAYQAPNQGQDGPYQQAPDQYGQEAAQPQAPQYDTANNYAADTASAAPDSASAASSYDPINNDYGAAPTDQTDQDQDQYADDDEAAEPKEKFHIGVTDILGAIFSFVVMLGVYIPGYFSNTASLVDFSNGTSLLSKMQLTSPAALRYLLLVVAAIGPLIFIVFSFWKRRSSPLIRFGAGVFSVIGYAFLFVLMFAKGAITTVQIQSTGFALIGYISLACLLGEFIIGLVDLMRS